MVINKKLWRRFVKNLKREKFLAVTNVSVMTVTFLMLGIFISVVFISQATLKYLENQAQITVFFKDDYAEEGILEMKQEIEADERVMEVSYISKEDALRIFLEINKNEPVLLESVSADILPASLEIKTKKLANLSGLAAELTSATGVEDVKFFEDVIEKFRTVSAVVYVVGLALVFVFMLISYAVILTTLRITINSRGVELEIQKLVGASNNYVKKPLVFQGVVFGLVSAVIASLVLVGVAVGLSAKGAFEGGLLLPFSQGASVSFWLFSVVLGVVLVFSGGVLGYVGSSVAVKRYLKV